MSSYNLLSSTNLELKVFVKQTPFGYFSDFVWALALFNGS